AYVYGNTLRDGPVGIGPLTFQTDGLSNVVFESNRVENAAVELSQGASQITIRNNILHRDDGPAIFIAGQNAAGRNVNDVVITNNTGINNGTHSNFIHVDGKTIGIVLDNNLYAAPKLETGGWGTAPIYVNWSDLSGF